MLRVVCVVVLGAVLVAGCTSGATTGQKNVDALTKAINRLGDSIKNGKSELEAMLAAYDQVINNEDGDLLTPFKTFHAGLDRVDKAKADIQKKGTEAEVAADAFFAQWQADLQKFQSEDMKKRSQDRLDTTRARFKEIDKASDEARGAYQPLMTTLRDHDLYLSNDLNQEAVKTLSKDAKAIKMNADTLFKLIDDVLKRIDKYNERVAMRQQQQQQQQQQKPAGQS
jgi:phosphoenolpyruvate-protein kinase (PTS system EI component)